MNWRDRIIGSIIALIVTIMGGFIVYSFTRPPSEKLIFIIEDPVIFETEETKISLITIKIANTGNKPAKEINAVLNIEEETPLLDKKLQSSSGLSMKYEYLHEKNRNIELFLPTIVPQEIVSLSMMVDGVMNNAPQISVRSSSSVVEEKSFVNIDKDKNYIGIIIDLVILVVFSIFGLIFIKNHQFDYFKNVNTAAFLCLHQGLAKEAEITLRNYLRRRGAGTYELLNYALALALNGNIAEAEKIFAAGEWLAKNNRARGLAEFNKSIMFMSMNNIHEAREHLRAAFKFSPDQISEYCSFSVHIKEAMANDQRISQIVELRGRAH